MRAFYTLLLLSFIGIGSWWIVANKPLDGIGNSNNAPERFLALEARYSPHQIMDTHRGELIQRSSQEYGDAALKFYPFLLMEVRFSSADKRMREGVLLWSKESGEMILDTSTWETTKGFAQGIQSGAVGHDYKLLRALAANGNEAGREDLRRLLHIGADTLDDWALSAQERELIVQKGNTIKLKQTGLKLDVEPQTKIHQWLLTKPYGHAKRAPSRFTSEQILATASIFFGPQLSIKGHKEVFLPVYSISVKDESGAEITTFWNALNGQRIPTKPSLHL